MDNTACYLRQNMIIRSVSNKSKFESILDWKSILINFVVMESLLRNKTMSIIGLTSKNSTFSMWNKTCNELYFNRQYQKNCSCHLFVVVTNNLKNLLLISKKQLPLRIASSRHLICQSLWKKHTHTYQYMCLCIL